MTKLEIQPREGVQGRWAIVMAESGQTVLAFLRSKKAAHEAMERLYTLPIRWDLETVVLPAVSTLPERTVTRLVDAESRSILLTEQCAVLGV